MANKEIGWYAEVSDQGDEELVRRSRRRRDEHFATRPRDGRYRDASQ